MFMSLLHLSTPMPFIILVLLLYPPSSISSTSLNCSLLCLLCPSVTFASLAWYFSRDSQKPVSPVLTYTAADHREVSKGWAWQAEHQSLQQGQKEESGGDFPAIVNSILGNTETTKDFANM